MTGLFLSQSLFRSPVAMRFFSSRIEARREAAVALKPCRDMPAKSKLTAVQNVIPVKAFLFSIQKVAVDRTPKLERGQATTSCGTKRSKPEVVPSAFKLTMKSSAVERYAC